MNRQELKQELVEMQLAVCSSLEFSVGRILQERYEANAEAICDWLFAEPSEEEVLSLAKKIGKIIYPAARSWEELTIYPQKGCIETARVAFREILRLSAPNRKEIVRDAVGGLIAQWRRQGEDCLRYANDPGLRKHGLVAKGNGRAFLDCADDLQRLIVSIPDEPAAEPEKASLSDLDEPDDPTGEPLSAQEPPAVLYIRKLEAENERLRSELAGMTKNRNRCFHFMSEIGPLVGMGQHDGIAPDAVLRNVKIKLVELADQKAENERLKAELTSCALDGANQVKENEILTQENERLAVQLRSLEGNLAFWKGEIAELIAKPEPPDNWDAVRRFLKNARTVIAKETSVPIENVDAVLDWLACKPEPSKPRRKPRLSEVSQLLHGYAHEAIKQHENPDITHGDSAVEQLDKEWAKKIFELFGKIPKPEPPADRTLRMVFADALPLRNTEISDAMVDKYKPAPEPPDVPAIVRKEVERADYNALASESYRLSELCDSMRPASQRAAKAVLYAFVKAVAAKYKPAPPEPVQTQQERIATEIGITVAQFEEAWRRHGELKPHDVEAFYAEELTEPPKPRRVKMRIYKKNDSGYMFSVIDTESVWDGYTRREDLSLLDEFEREVPE